MKKRIWELDALRGVCILGMIAVHTVFDLEAFLGLPSWDLPPAFTLISEWGGVLFLLLSGICVTFGTHPIRRGLTVLGCGMLITAVTVGMSFLELLDHQLIIWFGTLHCLGTCMLLWPAFRRLPSWLLAAAGAAIIAAGTAAAQLHLSFPWLIPLGFTTAEFSSGDYFPLLPYLGYFLLGVIPGRHLYSKKESLFPGVNAGRGLLRPLCFIGRHSLWFYLVHQPVIIGLLTAVQWFFEF